MIGGVDMAGGTHGQLARDFALLETLRWTPAGGFWLRERHLARLRRSAEHFGFELDRAVVERRLDEALAGQAGDRRVRLLLFADGRVTVEHIPMPETRPLRVALASAPVDPTNVFLYHKTTARQVYERAAIPGVDDVILWNDRQEVTESTVGNVVVEVDGRRVTPPVASGLLPGTFRAQLLDDGTVQEAVVGLDTLRRLAWCWIVNSVHGWRGAQLVEPPRQPGSEPRILDPS